MYWSHVSKTLGFRLIFVLKTKDVLNGWNMTLIYYVMDFSKSQKLQLFLKSFQA